MGGSLGLIYEYGHRRAETLQEVVNKIERKDKLELASRSKEGA